jgi:hypothetical protein
MPYNPNKDRFIKFDIFLSDIPSSRHFEVWIQNNSIHDIYENLYPPFNLLNRRNVTLHVESNLISNSSSSYDLFMLENYGTTIFTNNTIKNWDHSGLSHINIEYSDVVVISHIKFTGYSDNHSTTTSIIYFKMNSDSVATISDLVIDGNGAHLKMIRNTASMREITIMDSEFLNTKFDSDGKYIETGTVEYLNVTNCTFERMEYIDDSYSNSYVLSILAIKVSKSYNSQISEIRMVDSSISLLDFWKFEGDNSNLEDESSSSSLPTFTISNILLLNNIYTSYSSILRIEDFTYTSSAQIIISNTIFKNIIFKLSGNVVLFSHHMKQEVVWTNLTMHNVTNGEVLLLPNSKSKKEFDVKVSIDGLVAVENESSFSKIVEVNDGSFLVLKNSVFDNNFALEIGKVLGDDGFGLVKVSSLIGQIEIFNTTFIQNAVIEGGIFQITDGASLLCEDWLFNENFSIEGGIITASSNGIFYVNSSTIINNRAFSIPVGYIIDSQRFSTISNSTLINNSVISKQDYEKEMSSLTTWSTLWYLSLTAKQHLQQNMNLISIHQSIHDFEIIEGKLQITNNCKIQDN